MSVLLIVLLLVGCAALMIAERRGVRTTLQLSFKGDVKRETAFLAQWGQSIATPLCAIVIWQLDPPRHKAAIVFVVSVFGASVACFIFKRLLGRVRPNRPNAGQFLGPSWKHENYRESFPSSHSACAVAASAFLAALYPPAAATFWALGLITALLRYVLDAHWPSDVLGGIAIGYICAHAGLAALTRV